MKYNKQILNPFDKIYNLPFSASAAAGGGGGGKEDPEDYFWFKNEDDKDGAFRISPEGEAPTLFFEYSYDKKSEDWTSIVIEGTQTEIDVPAGQTLYLRGLGNFNLRNADRGGYIFSSIKRIQVSPFIIIINYSIGGNIMSLYDYRQMWNYTTINEYEFYNLFYVSPGNTSYMTDCSKLNFGNVTTILHHGCESMFYQWNGLITKAPDMSKITAIGQSGCKDMFGNTKLEEAPNLSNLTQIDMNGCDAMFNGCNELTTGADLSRVTFVSTASLKQMYFNCAKLKTVYTPDCDLLIGSQVCYNNWLSGAGGLVEGEKTIFFTRPSIMNSYTSVFGGDNGYTKQLMQ